MSVLLGIPDGCAVEVFSIPFHGEEGCTLTVAELRVHLGRTYKVLYTERLLVQAGRIGSRLFQLGEGEAAPAPPAQVVLGGPGSILQTLLLALRREGAAVSRLPGSPPLARKLCGHTIECRSESVSPEAFAANLARAPRPLRLLFLDVDGVLNTSSTWGQGHLEDSCLLQVAQLIHRSGARIVLSTSWRGDEGMRASQNGIAPGCSCEGWAAGGLHSWSDPLWKEPRRRDRRGDGRLPRRRRPGDAVGCNG
mmetsp:Transcript_14145/g.29659  ORF Transcript_14145/g.29659 Transcript_14145/m.29659 type:complete len:251 (+) Transcript_14145:55-807(+)